MMVKGLLVMDVDSTLIQEEVIDLLGQEAGCGEQIAAITERAMNGELDFREALLARVALLKGLSVSVFDRVLAQVHYHQGAKELVDTLHNRGYVIGLVSGGFEEIVRPLAEGLGITTIKANRLEVREGYLTGEVSGDIVTKETKLEKLQEWAAENGLSLSQTVAMGDGANDLLMIGAAGLGVAFCAKPVVRAQAPYQINEPDLYNLVALIDQYQ